MTLTEYDDTELRCRLGAVPLFSYVYRSAVPAIESPRPYFHPLNTVKGLTVTGFRPADHRWHHGLSMTLTDVSGINFWGGRTFVDPETGYRQLDNNGRQIHRDWVKIEVEGAAAEFVERLAWTGPSGDEMLAEHRRIGIDVRGAKDGYWILSFGTRLENTGGRDLAIGSPTTRGRPNAGYGGLYWRGPRSFAAGFVRTAAGISDADAAMGTRSPWLAFSGPHDEVDARSTLVFADSADNPRYPNKWFVRKEPGGYTGVSFALAYDEVYPLASGDSLDLSYRIIVADGERDPEELASAVR